MSPGLTSGRSKEGARFLTSSLSVAAERMQDGVTDRTWSARIEGRPRPLGAGTKPRRAARITQVSYNNSSRPGA